MHTIHLTSERLIQTKFTPSDYEDFSKLEFNPDVMKYISGEASTEEKARTKFEKVMGINAEHDELGFCIVRNKTDNSFIGLSKITAYENKVNPEILHAEIGYSMFPEFWGRGIATEITVRLIEYAKELGNIHELFGITHPDNTASIKVLTKQGFNFIDTGFFGKHPSVIYKLKIK